MVAWHELERLRPELAAAIRGRFEEGRDHVLATLRRDGSPRVSGIEVEFQGGELQLGMLFEHAQARRRPSRRTRGAARRDAGSRRR